MIKSRKIIWEGKVARVGRGIQIGDLWESQKERQGRTWVDNIKMDLEERG
jgi:hypothetical protein